MCGWPPKSRRGTCRCGIRSRCACLRYALPRRRTADPKRAHPRIRLRAYPLSTRVRKPTISCFTRTLRCRNARRCGGRDGPIRRMSGNSGASAVNKLSKFERRPCECRVDAFRGEQHRAEQLALDAGGPYHIAQFVRIGQCAELIERQHPIGARVTAATAGGHGLRDTVATSVAVPKRRCHSSAV